MSMVSDESPLGIGAVAQPTPRDTAGPSPVRRAWSRVRDGGATDHAAHPVKRWEWPVFAAILAVAAAFNCIGLAAEGYANSYYAATVRSMMSSWHNFFFASFDPGGFVTVDKPPAGFWVQVAFAKVFGFHGWSILLPQALAGVASVALLWWLVRRVWGPTAAIVAALALAVSPISVVTNRNNTIDSLLVLCVLGAVWALTRAIESVRHPLRWLLLAATLVGVGFNIKMLEAYLVVPALWLAYFLVARPRWYARISHLALASVLLVAVSLSWATAVDLTPADQRPYIGSSQTNSVLELALGYNGLQRFLGRGGESSDVSLQTIINNFSGEENAANGFAGGAGGVGGTSENGEKGLLRLLNLQLGGQIGWLAPLAALGLFAAAWQVRPRRLRFWRFAASAHGSGPLRRRRGSVIIWGTWFLTMAVFFSFAGFYHRYYLSMLAPGVAALVGLGTAALWQAWQLRGWRGVLGLALPVGFVGTALMQRDILADYPTWSARLATPIVAVSVVAAAVLALAWPLRGRLGRWASYPARAALAVGLAALLVAPSVWSGISVQAASNGQSSNLPAAGPSTGNGGPGGMAGGAPQTRTAGFTANQGRTAGGMAPPTGSQRGEIPNGAQLPAGVQPPTGTGAGATNAQMFSGGGMGQVDSAMLQWLIANQGTADFILAVGSSQQASSIIIETGLPVMAMGGFSGSDPILTTAELQQLVQDGTVRYFLGGGGGARGGSGNASSWVSQNCTAVNAITWGGTSTSQLYDCAAK